VSTLLGVWLDKTARRGKPFGRALLILLLLSLTTAAQASAFDPQHESHHAPGHCCLLCHTGPMPILRTIVPAAVAPVFLLTWLVPTPSVQPVHEVLLAAGSSRAPPIQ
jgi:hypothetical protein